MSDVKPSEIDELRMVYQEIIEGCSYSSEGFFIKHLCDLEKIELTRKRIEFINKYIKEGIPTEKERLLHLKETEEWGGTQESDIFAYKQTISDNEKLVNTIIPQQQEAVKRIILEHKRSLFALLMQKKTLIGTTAEELADKDGSYFLAYLSLFADRECSKPLFSSWEDFDSLEENESNRYLNAIDDILCSLSEQNVRRISVLPFFLNAFSYSKETIHTFLNKPISRLTDYQVTLFSLGARNLNILSQAEGSPPEYFENTPIDEILRWYDLQYSIIIGKRKQSSHT